MLEGLQWIPLFLHKLWINKEKKHHPDYSVKHTVLTWLPNSPVPEYEISFHAINPSQRWKSQAELQPRWVEGGHSCLLLRSQLVQLAAPWAAASLHGCISRQPS